MPLVAPPRNCFRFLLARDLAARVVYAFQKDISTKICFGKQRELIVVLNPVLSRNLPNLPVNLLSAIASKMDAMLRDRLSMLAALGAGVVVGISGIYMYYKVNRTVSRELTQLTGTIEHLRREIEELKRHAPSRESVERKPQASSSSGAVRFSAAASSSSQDEEEEEFFDFTDSEDKPSSNGGGISEGEEELFQLLPWLEGVDALLDGTPADREDCYTALKSRQEQLSDNVDFLWRLAKASHLHRLVAQKTGDNDLKKRLAFQAHETAKLALEKSKGNPEVHKWFAITLGALGEFVSLQEKITNGYIFKEHVDLALKLKPKDPTLHHLLGRWCYEVSMLSWLERRVVSSLFQAPPESSLANARQHLLKADELLPRWKENMLYVAKSYIGDSDYGVALTWLDRASLVPAKSEDDDAAQEEVELLQNKFKGYRS